MLKRFLILPLIALLLSGCNTMGPRSVRVVTFDQGTRFAVVNDSGRDLRQVKIRIWVLQEPVLWDGGKKRIEFWPAGESFDFPANFNHGIDEIELSGRTDHGSFFKVFDCRKPVVTVDRSKRF